MREAKELAQGLQKTTRAPALWAQGSAAAPAREQAVCATRRDRRLVVLHLAEAAPEPDVVRPNPGLEKLGSRGHCLCAGF